ncbi:MAG: hypothetical protein AAF840_10340 [Bacteroidota bacterium]
MPDQPGQSDDLNEVFKDAEWLKKCVVSHRIREEKGRFWVEMIFTDRHDPLRKLIRPISDHPSRAVAERHADILQRQISADPRDPRPKDKGDADHIFPN